MIRGIIRSVSPSPTIISANRLKILPAVRGYHRHRRGTTLMPVPNVGQVRPGASVSIVLKADQRTGREVTGQVQDLLTRGDHPRGIKVRLRDGRIGRVQRMVDVDAVTTDARHQEHIGSDRFPEGEQHDMSSGTPLEVHTTGAFSQHRSRARDVRLDDHLEPPTEQADLMAYVKPAKQRKGRKQMKGSTESQETIEVTCPVCEQFKGDEAAVRHHIETHFRED